MPTLEDFVMEDDGASEEAGIDVAVDANESLHASGASSSTDVGHVEAATAMDGASAADTAAVPDTQSSPEGAHDHSATLPGGVGAASEDTSGSSTVLAAMASASTDVMAPPSIEALATAPVDAPTDGVVDSFAAAIEDAVSAPLVPMTTQSIGEASPDGVVAPDASSSIGDDVPAGTGERETSSDARAASKSAADLLSASLDAGWDSSVSNADPDVPRLAMVSLSDDDLTRPLPASLAIDWDDEGTGAPLKPRGDHPTPTSPPSLDELAAMAAPPSLPGLPDLAGRRPPLAAPVPAGLRRPSDPAFPSAAALPSATSLPPVPVPPPTMRRTIPPPSRHGEFAESRAAAAPPRSVGIGPTENTPTIQISPLSADSPLEFTPTVQVQRLKVPAFPMMGSDRDPTLPKQLPPPGPEVDRDPRSPSIPPVAGSVAPPPWRRPPMLQRSQRPWVAGIALAAVTIGALAFVLRPRTGDLTVTASTTDGSEVKGLSVRVDGVERCASSPCEVKDLASGTHLVSAAAPGFAPGVERALVLEAGEHAAHHVTLVTEQRAHSELSVSAIGSNLRVVIDGQDLGAPPVTIHDVAPGTHSVRVLGNSGYYEAYDQSVNVEPGELRSLGPIRLRVLKGRLELTDGADSEGAYVTVDGRRVGHLPTEIDLSAGDSHEIQARKRGFMDFTRQVVFDGNANQNVEITLTPAEGGATQSSPSYASAPAPVRSSSAVASRPATQASAPASSPGLLDITSTPPSRVVVNGRPMGMTPLHGVRVEPGHQTVVFVNPDLGRRIASANVASGGRAKVGVTF
jgi:hypothetical protein